MAKTALEKLQEGNDGKTLFKGQEVQARVLEGVCAHSLYTTFCEFSMLLGFFPSQISSLECVTCVRSLVRINVLWRMILCAI